MLAVKKGHTKTVAALLEAEADANTTTRELGCDFDWSALAFAAFRGRDEIVKLLLAAHADAHYMTPLGKTALVLAQDNGHSTAADLIREAAGRLLFRRANLARTRILCGP